MSLDSDLWGAFRAQASKELSEELHKTRPSQEPAGGDARHQDVISSGDLYTRSNAAKRKADDAPVSSQHDPAAKKPKTQWTGWPLSIISSNSASRGKVPSSTAPAVIDLTGDDKPSPRLPSTLQPSASKSQVLHKQSQLSFEGSWSNVPPWPASQRGRTPPAEPAASSSEPTVAPAGSAPVIQGMQASVAPAKINDGDYHVVRVGW